MDKKFLEKHNLTEGQKRFQSILEYVEMRNTNALEEAGPQDGNDAPEPGPQGGPDMGGAQGGATNGQANQGTGSSSAQDNAQDADFEEVK